MKYTNFTITPILLDNSRCYSILINYKILYGSNRNIIILKIHSFYPEKKDCYCNFKVLNH